MISTIPIQYLINMTITFCCFVNVGSMYVTLYFSTYSYLEPLLWQPALLRNDQRLFSVNICFCFIKFYYSENCLWRTAMTSQCMKNLLSFWAKTFWTKSLLTIILDSTLHKCKYVYTCKILVTQWFAVVNTVEYTGLKIIFGQLLAMLTSQLWSRQQEKHLQFV